MWSSAVTSDRPPTQQLKDEQIYVSLFGYQVPDMALYGQGSDNCTAPRKTVLKQAILHRLPIIKENNSRHRGLFKIVVDI